MESDRAVVERQLGRPPRAFRRVVRRCPFGRPAVTEQEARDDSGEQLARETISRYQSLEGSRADKQNLSLVELDLGRGIVQRPQPDPDEAASMCLRAINVDEPERSDLVRRTAHEVLQLLSPWAERDSVQAFADALRCYRPVAVGS